MKKTVLLTLFFTSFAFSQNIRFEGIIQDANKAPLEMANIMAMNQGTKAMDAYAITNDKGKFVLNLKPNSTYTIKLSFLGMQNKEITVTTQTQNITQNITMETGGIELEGVEIVREMPVSIHGDTISYNADSFKTGTEKKLEDVLKKLPGVEVNADGEVEVEGKKVTKLMVEGKDFFDGDTKLGVKNIPADAIDKVQVLRNYNENSILKGVENNQDNIAMNIKLKAGKKNFWFGDMTAGGGGGEKLDRYIVNPKVFYYNPKYSLNLITNFNNIGELPLTIQDYFKMSGGFKNMMLKGGSSFNVSSNDLGISLLRNDRAKDIDTKFGAANFSYNPTKNWNLSGFGIFSASKTEIVTDSQTSILANNVQINNNETDNQKSNFGLFKLSSSYKPNTNFQFDYDILGKLTKQDEISSLFRQTVTNSGSNDENIFTKKKQSPSSFNQNLGLYYTLNDKNVFAFEAQHLYQDEDPFYNANLETQPFNLTDYISGQNRNNLNQNRFVKTNKIDTKFDYYYMLTPKSNINVTLGNTYSHQNFNTHIFQILDNGTQNDLNSPENNNDVSYNFNDTFLGLHYKILTGKFTFTPGVSLHTYSMSNQQLGSSTKNSFTRAVYFSRNISDNIVFVGTNNPPYGYYTNADKQKVKGLELEASVNFGKVQLTANYVNLDGKIETNNGTKDTSFFNLYRRPRQTMNVNVGIVLCKNWNMNVGIQSISKRYEPVYNSAPIEMPAYYVWNLYSTYSITKNIKAFIDLKNITDEKYSEVRGYNSRRFNFMAGVNLSF